MKEKQIKSGILKGFYIIDTKWMKEEREAFIKTLEDSSKQIFLQQVCYNKGKEKGLARHKSNVAD